MLVQRFHFARTKEVEMDKMFITPRMRRAFCFCQIEKKKMGWSKYISYECVLQKMNWCSPDIPLLLLPNYGWSGAAGLGTLCKDFTRKTSFMT